MKTDWEKIKAEYIGGKSREEICTEYGIKYKTLDNRIFQGKWNEQIKEFKEKVREKTIEKASESLADRQAKAILEQFEHSDFLLDESIKLYKSNPDYLGHVKLLADTIEKAYKLKRQAIGLKDETDLNLILKRKEKEYTDEELKEELKKRNLPVLDIEE